MEYSPDWLERTDMGWIVDADGLYDLLTKFSKDAPGLQLFITENGCAAEDYVNPEGLAGYYVWSLARFYADVVRANAVSALW